MTDPLTDLQRADLFQRACSEFANYFWTELGWDHFRAEFLGDMASFKNRNASSENVKIIVRALEAISSCHPLLREVIMKEKT